MSEYGISLVVFYQRECKIILIHEKPKKNLSLRNVKNEVSSIQYKHFAYGLVETSSQVFELNVLLFKTHCLV